MGPCGRGRCALLLAILSLTFFSCAFRDNRFDPLSPFHRPPYLTVDCTPETDQNYTITNDSISAAAPFKLQLTASSVSFFDETDTVPVFLNHFLDGQSIRRKNNFQNETIIFLKIGTHHLAFEATDPGNNTTSKRAITVSIIYEKQPRIVSFELKPDTLPLYPLLDSRPTVYFHTTISDTEGIADTLSYNLGPLFAMFPTLEYPITASDTLFTDSTARFSFSAPEDTLEKYPDIRILAILKDKVGRTDTAEAYVHIRKNVYYGSPPHIDSIYILERPPVMIAGKQINFGVHAVDYPDIGDTIPKDTTLLMYYWNFGDGGESTHKLPTYIYTSPGTYNVKVSVTDEHMNVTTDSIPLTIMPRQDLRPFFTLFNVTLKSSTLPCTVYVSAAARDDDGYISSLLFIFDDMIVQPELTQVTDLQYVFTSGMVHEIYALGIDDEGLKCDTTYILELSESAKGASP